MPLTKIAIRRPVLIAMVWVALGVLGIRFAAALPVEFTPNIELATVIVTTVYPGAGPQEVENVVTKPIEDAVSTVSGVKSVTSSSRESVSTVTVEFVLGTDANTASNEVREKLDAIRGNLPRDAKAPVLQRFSLAAFPILSLSATSQSRSPQELRDLADRRLKNRLEQISGVASVTVLGGEVREVQLNVDRESLQMFRLSINQVLGALLAENLNVPAGTIDEGRRQTAIRALGEFQTLEEIRQLKLGLPGGGSVTLGDLATVSDTVEERSQISRLNGTESVGILVRRASDANTVRVANGVKGELARIAREYPDLRVTVVDDQSVFTRDALNDVFIALVLGAALAVVIVFLFLGSAVSTFIISLAIPTSLLSAFIVISALGLSLNVFTMLGLSLAIGILIDDSIVVLENIIRHLEGGELPSEAAMNGRSEIGMAAVAITLVDVVIFVPIALSSGLTGKVLRPFGFTVATVTLFSLFAAFTLTPMLAARWLKRRSPEEEGRSRLDRVFAPVQRFYAWLDARYEAVLRWALRRRGTVVAAGILSLLVVLPLASRLGFEFLPSTDQGVLAVSVEMPPGTSLDTTSAVTAQVESRLLNVPEVKEVLTAVGTDGVRAGSQLATLTAKLAEKSERVRSDRDVVRALQRDPAANALPGARVVYSIPSLVIQRSPVEIRISGPDQQVLEQVAAQVAERIRRVPGARDVDISSRPGRPELQVQVDRVRASELGLTTGQVTSILRSAVQGNTDGRFRSAGEEYALRVRMTERGRKLGTAEIPSVLIGTLDSRPIYMRDVAQVVQGTGPTQIDRRNRQRVLYVTANLEPGFFAGNVNRTVAAAIRDIRPAGITLEPGGEAERTQEFMTDIGIALGLAVILIYILLSGLFESTFTPLAIMLAIPLALVGAVLTLYATGKTLSLSSAVGIILLVGLVLKNSILLIDYTNTLRARGMSRNEAILRAGPTRLRPVIMTTLAVILASLPTALEFGKGSELRSPLALAVIGGLTWSTMLTLVVIPVMYTLLDDLRAWAGRLRAPAAREPECPAPQPASARSSGSVEESAT